MMFVLLNLHHVFYVCVITRYLNGHVMSVCLYVSLNVQKVPVFSMYMLHLSVCMYVWCIKVLMYNMCLSVCMYV